jgi:hypothetical protein
MYISVPLTPWSRSRQKKESKRLGWTIHPVGHIVAVENEVGIVVGQPQGTVVGMMSLSGGSARRRVVQFKLSGWIVLVIVGQEGGGGW